MLFADQTETEVKLSLNRAELTGGGTDAPEARRAVEYYRDIVYQQDDLYDTLKPLFANLAKWKARPKACYNLTAGITDAISTLYHDPVVYEFDDAQAAAIWSEIPDGEWLQLMADVDKYTLLSGTLGVRPVVKDGQITWHLYLGDQLEYVQEPEDAVAAQQIVVRWKTGQAMARSEVAHYWTAQEYAETVNDRLTGTIEPNPYQQIPIVLFRNEEPRWSWFGKPASDLIAANVALNSMMTDLNHTVRWQAHGQLVLVGAPPNYQPPIGSDTFISVSNAPNSTGADARYINPGADIQAIINSVNQNLDMLFSARRIPKSAVVAIQGDSGVSLVAQQAALRDYRKRRIAIFRPLEQQLISLTLTVMHYHATGELKEFDPPRITYTELEAPMQDEARLDWDWKLRLGVASAVDVMMTLNPGMSEKEAEAKIAENLARKQAGVVRQIGARREERAAAEPEPMQDEPDEPEDDAE